MKRLLLLAFVLLFVGVFSMGCLPSYEKAVDRRNLKPDEQKEYDRIQTAILQVLDEKGFLVREKSSPFQNVIVAKSQQSLQGEYKLRTKILAWVARDEDGFLDHRITVLQQKEWKRDNFRSDYQPEQRWINIGRNKEDEIKLYNEIDRVLLKGTRFKSHLFKSALKKLEKMKKAEKEVEKEQEKVDKKSKENK